MIASGTTNVEVQVNLRDKQGAPLDLTGVTDIKVRVKNPVGRVEELDGTVVDAEGGQVTTTIAQAQAGLYRVAVRVHLGGRYVTTHVVTFPVKESLW